MRADSTLTASCAALALVALTACGEPPNRPVVDGSTSADATSAAPMCATNRNDEVRLKLAAQCESCHGARAGRPFFASLASFEDLLVYNTSFVVRGDPDNSPLVAMLEGRATGAYRQMPLGGEPFATLASRGQTRISMDEIRDWIRTLPPPDPTREGPDPAQPTTRRLSADEAINALAIALGQPANSGVPPLLQLDGPQPLSPDSPQGVDYNDALRRDVYLMLGGASYLAQRRPERSWSPGSLLAFAQVAQGICARAAAMNSAQLFKHVSAGDRLPMAEANARRNIAYLYERFLHEPAPQSAIDALFTRIYQPAERTSTRVGWTQVCVALARDPLFVTF